MDENVKVCFLCQDENQEQIFRPIFSVFVELKNDTRFVGINKFLEELSEYAQGKYYHLSGSQILLFRYDIVIEFLKEKYKDREVMDFYLKENFACEDCYEKYKELIPLR